MSRNGSNAATGEGEKQWGEGGLKLSSGAVHNYGNALDTDILCGLK